MSLKLNRPLALCFLFCVSLCLSARCDPQVVFRPEDQQVVRPVGSFDTELTQKLLEPGSCTIRGIAFDRQESGFLEREKPNQPPPAGSSVYLFPYTEYCQEFVQLAKKHSLDPEAEYRLDDLRAGPRLNPVTGEGLPDILPRVRVDCDPMFVRIWRKAVTDGEGHFVFENVKPGKYYLQSVPFIVARRHGYSVKVGEDTSQTYWSNGMVTSESTPVWADKKSTTFRKVQLAGRVEISAGEALKTVEIRSDWRDL